jgi:hypothetical protein
MLINCKRILVLLTLVGVAVPTICVAKGITIEAEAFTAYNDTGGQMVQSLPLSGCSGGYALIGLDAAGEWTEYDVPVTAFGRYTFMFKCRGDFGVAYNFQLIFSLESGAKETVNFSFVGMGYG